MWNWLKRHKIRAGIICLIGLLSAIITIVQGWNDFVRTLGNIVKLAAYLKTDIQLPLWGIILLLAFALTIPIVVCAIYFFCKRRSIENYFTDEYSGRIWDWEDDLRESYHDLKALCPRCSALMKTHYAHDFQEDVSVCVNPKCGYAINSPNPDNVPLCEMVKIEFDRRIRTGKYKSAKRRIRQTQKAALNTPAQKDRKVNNLQSDKPSEYVRDGFNRLVWEFDRAAISLDPHPVCAKCFTIIKIGGQNQRVFECQSCGRRVDHSDTYNNLYNLAKLEFERRNRNWNKSEAEHRIQLVQEEMEKAKQTNAMRNALNAAKGNSSPYDNDVLTRGLNFFKKK